MTIIINDNRLSTYFSKTTFSNFKKNELLKAFTSSLDEKNMEKACYYVSEMVCSSYFIEIWNILINYVCKFIHVSNPRLIIYLKHKMYRFKVLAKSVNKDDIEMRNNTEIRNMFCELVIIICKTNSKTSLHESKVKVDDLNIEIISKKFEAPNYSYIGNIFQDGDPREIYMAVNEFTYHISKESKNYNLACYWFEWINVFDEYCRKKKQKIVCNPRNFCIVNKGKTDIVWCIWDSLLTRANQLGKGIHTLMNSLCDMYQLKYDHNISKKRKYVIYNAIYICVENVDFSIALGNDFITSEFLNTNTNKLYAILKKSEIQVEEQISNKDDKINNMNKYLYNFDYK